MSKAFKKEWVGYCGSFKCGKEVRAGEVWWGRDCIRCENRLEGSGPPREPEIEEFNKEQDARETTGQTKVPMFFEPGCMYCKSYPKMVDKKETRHPVRLCFGDVFVGCHEYEYSGRRRKRYFCPECHQELSPNIFEEKGGGPLEVAFCHNCNNVFSSPVVYKGWGIVHVLKKLVGFGRPPTKKSKANPVL